MIRLPALAFLVGLWLGSSFSFFPVSTFLFVSASGIILSWMTWTNRLSTKQGVMAFCSLLAGLIYWAGAIWLYDQTDLRKWVGSPSVQVTGSIMQPVRRAPDRVGMVI